MNWQRGFGDVWASMADDRSAYLVETEWLNERLDDQSIRILDVTGMLTSELKNVARERAYDEGHIPGAVFFDIASAKGALSDPSAALPWTWPPTARVEAALAEHGVGNDTKVIIYAASPRLGVDFGPMWCTRAWWVMHHFGAACAILNGGYEKWVAEGRPVSTETVKPPQASFVATRDGRNAIATKDDVRAALADGGTRVVDALSPASYAGKDKMVYGPRKGHITGAINFPMFNILSGEGLAFADRETLKARLSDCGLSADEPVISYCGGGIAATIDAFALKQIGNDQVRVYDGSLMEWSSDESLPMTDPSDTSGTC